LVDPAIVKVRFVHLGEGKAIMGTEGSAQDPVATYSFVISISRTDVKTNVKGGGFLPRLLSIWIRIRNVPKRRRSLLGLLHGYMNSFAIP
jgi:hypothetical protein